MSDYTDFLKAKVRMAETWGFEIDPAEVHPILKPHQRAMVCWLVAGGRRACFASFGLGKTVIDLEAVRITRARAGGMALIVIPLGVRGEFMRDAAMLGITVTFVRRIEECTDPDGIYLTNYETVRDGKLDPRLFSVASLDEAACLRGFGGTKTFREFMALFAGDDRRDHLKERIRGQAVRYRFVFTATPSPNEYIELLAYSAFLGIMDVGQAKTRFFKRDSTKADALTIHPHKTKEFWMWMASWALFVSKPSDLCNCLCHNGKTSSASNSGSSPFAAGYREHCETAHGAASAAAVASASQPPTTCSPGRSSVAAASDRGMGGRGRGRTPPGAACLIESRTTSHTSSEESPSATDGSDSPPSLKTSDSRRSAERLSATTTTEDTNPEIAAGQHAKSRRATHAEPFASRTPDGNSHSPHGRKSCTSSTGPSTPGIAPAGHRSGCSSDSCVLCAELDRGYELPALDVQWHEILSDHSAAGSTSYGQGLMFKEAAIGIVEASREKRGSMQERLAKVVALMPADRSEQVILWCDLNDEQRALERALKAAGVSASSLHGGQGIDEREGLMQQWRDRSTTAFLSKPSMYGAGVNLQQAHTMIFAGIGFKFSDLIQAIHRIYRFLQARPCTVHLIYTEAEREVRRTLERKWEQHRAMTQRMADLIKEFGLSHIAMAHNLTRKLGVTRQEIRGRSFVLANNDCVDETKRMESGSVGLVLTSIPFSTQYEYSPNYADFGHTDTNEHFFQQMDYLTPELMRVLQPGRLAAIHVKDRIVPGGMTGLGFQTVYPFHCRTIEHFTRHGFAYMGMKTIVTDVVRENNQTYRLGWSEQCKDASKMGVGMPEYLLIFRKPPSDTTNSYADKPVVKLKPFSIDADGNMVPFDREKPMVRGTGYSRSRWQVDAHGFTRSSGQRLLTPEELQSLPHEAIFKIFRDQSLRQVYDFEKHVSVSEALEVGGRLPVTFMLLQPQSWSDEVWTDITRMLTLNGAQSAKGKEMHLCLARDSKVLTKERGYVPIQYVQVGEHVLTHKGRWRPVRIVRETGIQPVLTLRAHGVPGLTLTPDHKLWMRKSEWARERDGAERADPKWIEAQESLGGYVNQKLPDEELHAGDETLWWTVGRWIADGHIDVRGSAIISCGPAKWKRFLDKIGDFGGNTPHVGTAMQLQLRDPDRKLRAILEQCGSGAADKRLPPVAYTLPVAQAAALLDGYLAGDGHLVPDRGNWLASSISRDLLLGLSFLIQRVHGAIASIHAGRPEREHVIEGRSVHARQEWNLGFDMPGGRKRPFILDDGAWKKVRALEDAGEAETWCLRVEEDESFTAEGCIVKNCPMQFDLADRAIAQWTMEGEEVYDPFGGLMTVPYRAVLKGRRGRAAELNAAYFFDGAAYCRAAELEVGTPSLFDIEPLEAAA